ncbi:ABC transporter ATP-binding protein [Pasteurellaceae bacterium LIM206]|nr:ABC transporter ATP-binding protein [Pasteurellaceae bacterium LIM206]
MLTIKNLYFQHNENPLLNDIDLQLDKGDLLTILGGNGRGKSTLLNCIAGLLKPKSGEILLNGRNLQTLSPQDIAKQIAYVSQQSPETYQYEVRDYVVLGRAAHVGIFGKPQKADYQAVEQALEKLGIAELNRRIYMHLSGGQKQLVNIAKILVQQPELILFDEPTSALDYGNVFKTLTLIKELSEQHFSIIMTTHNPDHPMLLYSKLPHSKVAILNSRGKLEVGRADEIITEANLNALYQTELKLVYVNELGRRICGIKQI